VLHGFRSGGRANCLNQLFSLHALVPKYPYLHELVAFQIQVDFAGDLGRKPGVADRDYRLEVVCAGAQGAALGGRETHGLILRKYLNRNSLSARHGCNGCAER
jgi:hypothetical protein